LDDYFSNHYASINDINLNSEESIRNWYRESAEVYEREFLPYAGTLQNKKVMELGCGIGGLLNFLKMKGGEKLLGIDSSEEQLSICRKFVTDKVILASAEEFLESNKQKFDLIILYDLIEHFKKDSVISIFELIHKTLSERGRVIIRTPNMGYLFAPYSRYIDFTHEIGFTEESIKQVLRSAGFKNISVENSYIGKKRLWLNKKINNLIKFIYNYRVPKIVTSNMIAIAKK